MLYQATLVQGKVVPGIDLDARRDERVICEFNNVSEWVPSSGMTVTTETYTHGFPALRFTATPGVRTAKKTFATPLNLSTVRWMDIWWFMHDDSVEPTSVTMKLYSGAESHYYDCTFVSTPRKFLGWTKFRYNLLDEPGGTTPGGKSAGWTTACLANITAIEVVINSVNLEVEYSVSVGRISVYNLLGAVMFHVDDGHLTVFNLARKVFNKYGIRPSLWVVTGKIDTDPAYMTSRQLKRLADFDGWFIGSHTHTHPGLTTLTEDQIRTECRLSQSALRRWGLLEAARYLAAPGGASNDTVAAVVGEYFDAYRVSGQLLEYVPLRTFNMPYYSVLGPTHTPTTVQGWIADAVAKQAIVSPTFHKFTTDPSGSPDTYYYNINDLDAILAYVANNNIPTITFGDYVRRSPIILSANGTWISEVSNRVSRHFGG